MNLKRSKVDMIEDEMIMNKIYILRGKKVMIDEDLAILYNSGSAKLKNIIRRNTLCFPDDFMFKLNHLDFESLKMQNSTILRPYPDTEFPLAFTEQGLAMLFGLVKGARSIAINIRIIRIFTLIRRVLPDAPELHNLKCN